MAVQDYELLLRVRADLNQALSGLDNLKSKLGTGGQAADRMAASGSKATGVFRALGAAVAAVGIARLVKDYFSAADAASNMAAKIRLVTDSTADQVAAQKKLFEISQQTSADLGTTTELYVKLAQSSDVLRKNQTLLTGTTKLVNQALVLSGADAGTASGVVRQFAQAMASGVLRGDEFNSIMEGAPRLAKAMADGLGVPVGALRAMSAQGKLTADNVIQALQDQGAVVEKEFSSMPITVGRAMQQVKNSLQSMIGDADQSAGASRDVAGAIQDLAHTLESQEVKDGFETMISGLVTIAKVAADGLAKVSALTKFVGEELARRSGNYAVDDPIGISMGLDRAQEKLDILQARASNKWLPDAMKRQLAPQITAAQAEVTRLQKLLDVSRNYKPPAPKDTKPESGTTPPKPHVTPASTGPDKDALAAAKAAAKAADDAQKSQIQSLIALQGALDPTTKIWADYNAEVAKQNDLAKTQKAVAGADVEAIDARRDAIVQLAGVVRDNSLAELAKKDQQAWETLRDSLRTPAEVSLDDALDKIRQLNELLDKGALSAPEYHDALSRIGKASAPTLPDYQGVDAVVGGSAGELIKASKASQALEQAHAAALAENRKFTATNAAEAEAAAAQLLAIEEEYQRKRAALDQAQQSLTLATAADGFGQLADVMKSAYGEQSKQYRIAFALQKAAAIAQSMLAIQTSIAESSKLGFPWNLVSIAGAVAQGVGLLASVRNVNPSGFSEGGYTGAGGKYQPAGVVHAGEVVWSQRDIARAGGVSVVEALRRGYPGYVDGGLVNPLANVPGPAPNAGANLRLPRAVIDAAGGAANDGTRSGRAAPQDVKVVVVMDRDAMAEEIMNSPAGQKVIVQTAGDNPRSIQAKWGR